MLANLRASLWLLGSTLILCSGAYPLALWGVGQTLFSHQAEGSILMGPDQKPVGSRLIAQAFSGDEYFQPRPSATSGTPFNAAASGAPNFAANNPKLRGRVAQALGTIVRYHSIDGPDKGVLVGGDVEQWFQTQNDPSKGQGRRDLTAEWATRNPSLIAGWATSAEPVGEFVKTWAKEHPGVLAAWKAKNPAATEDPSPADLASYLFDPAVADSFVRLHPGMWPVTVEVEKDGKKTSVIKPGKKGDEIRSTFFDMWLQEHPNVHLEKVPADMVMTSASGLDPHITLKNAYFQLDRVADKWAEKTRGNPGQIRFEIETLLREKSASPLGGLVGVPLVNVLEVNLAVSERMRK